MKKTWLRIAASLLATVLFITSAPLGIFASVLDDVLNGGLLEDDSSASASGTNTPTIEVPKYSSSPVYQIEYVGWEDEQTEFRQDETSGIWIIDSPNALRQFEEKVNGGNSFEGETVELRANIDYSGDVAWTPVGYHKDRPFMGTFNGCGREIINLDITYKSKNGVDSEVYYIGFFGYVKNATVRDFGIYSYSVDQDYNYDVEIGGMVGHSEGSSFTNCYADGEIRTGFETINPLERDDVVVTSTFPYDINYSNPHGQGVIVDLSGNDKTSFSTTRKVSGDVSALKIIGNGSKVYSGITISIEEGNWPYLLIVFENFHAVDFKIISSSGKSIYISSKATSLTARQENYAIDVPNASLHFVDYNDLFVYGGVGKSAEGQKAGTIDGNDAIDGWCGIVADRVVVNTEGGITVYGGTGGTGANGAMGNGGQSYGDGSFWSSKNGGEGGTGGAGGKGGQGGLAVFANQIKGIKGSLTLFGGNSGNGGTGGQGGPGGKGEDASGVWDTGGNGGSGGKGGKGGNAYYGISPTNNTPILSSPRAIIALVNGKDGSVGAGGGGGTGGAGGGTDGWWWASAGQPGGSLGAGNYGDMISPNYSFGLFDTEIFRSGNNCPFGVYDNTGAGVSFAVQESSSHFPYELKVFSQGGAGWGIHQGGIVKSVSGEAGKAFYSVIYAKIPVGYKIGAYANSLGNGAYTEYLTSREGTGDYEWYVIKTQCGDSGIIEDFGYLAITGDDSARNIAWNIAYYNIYRESEYSVSDMTDDAYQLSDATATIGGFAGVVDENSSLTKCATTIDIDRKQEYGAKFEENGHYYQLFTNEMTYHEAKAYCQSLGGYLVTVTSAAENSFVYSLTAGHQVWLGGSDRATENSFQWETGETFSYSNWHSGEPNDGGGAPGQDYMQMWEGGTWDDLDDDAELRCFICEWDSHAVEGKFAGVQYGVAREVIAAKRDDEGNLREHDYSTWFGNREMYNGHQYAYIPCYLTFDEAIEFCEKLGGHLATIGSAQENAWVHSMMQGSDMWLGGTDRETEGEFKWITGEPFEYSNWAPSEPNNVGEGGQHYAQMYLNGTWDDVGERNLPFVCEWDSETADTDIAVLNKFVDNEKTYNDVDAQGLVYSNGITAQNNRVSECAVLGKIGEACDVRVPASVFGGRFIMDVTSIVKYALARDVAEHPYGGSLKSFTSGKNVKTIEEYAFYKSDVTSVSIGTLDDYSEGQVQTEIGKEAFVGCTALEEITLGDCVTSVGSNLLKDCNSLQSIRIGASLTSIPEVTPRTTSKSSTPFGLVKKESVLKEYVVSERNPNFTSVDGILYEKFYFRMDDGTGREFNLPVAVIDAPVNVALDGAVYRPENYVVRIYPYAFSYNKKITEVHLDYIREVGTGAFEECVYLTTVQFGELEIADDETVKILDKEYPKATEKYSTAVGSRAFAGCIRLNRMNLDSEVLEQIGTEVFQECATAPGVDAMEIVLGKNIRMIAATDDELYRGVTYTTGDLYKRSFAGAFDGANVKSFDVAEGSESFVALDGVLFYKSKETMEGTSAETLWLAAYPIGSPREEYSVGNLDGDTYCTFRVAPYAFAGTLYLQDLTIGNNVTTISDHALDNMGMLDVLTLGEKVAQINPDGGGITVAFIGCKNLHAIEVDEANKIFRDVDGVLMTKDGTTLIKYPEAKPGAEYETPVEVKEIMDNAFKGNVQLQSITLSGEITQLGNGVFNECTNLSLIYFKTGDAPYKSPEEVDKSNAFFTGHPRALVCYGEKTDTWEKLQSAEYWSKENTLDGKKVKAFTIKEYTIPEDYEENTGYYVFVVLDKSGTMLNNINVNLEGSRQSIDTINGIAVFYDLDYTKQYKLTVFDNTGEYFPFENASFYLDEKTRITYITLSSVPTVSGVNVAYKVDTENKIVDILGPDEVIGDQVNKVVDINSQTAKINKWCINDITIKVTTGMDSDVSILGYSIVQDGQKKKTQTDSATLAKELCEKKCESYSPLYLGKRTIELTTSISTDYLDVEKDVYIIVHFSDGSQVPCKLNIHVFELSFVDIDLSWLTKGLKFDINMDSFSFLGGASYEVELFPELPLSFKVEIEEDSYKITIKTKDASVAGGWKCSLQGSVEIKYEGLTEDGKNDIKVTSTVGGIMKGSIEFDSIPTIMVVCIPVKIEMELSVTNKLQFKLVFDDGYLIPEGIEYELKAAFEIKAGVGCAALSVGIYGNVELIFLVGLYPEIEMKKIELGGDVGIYGKLDLGIVKLEAKYSLLKNALGLDTTTVIYENGEWFPEENKVPAPGARAAAILYDESNYVLATSSFDPQTMTFSLNNGFEDPEETYAGIAPQMVQVGDLVYIVYHEDLNGYSDLYDQYNYQKLVYQIYNMADDSFSDVYVLDDNGKTDGGFELFTDGESVVIAYTQSNATLVTDDHEEMMKYVASMEIKTAVLKDGEFVPSETPLTQDNYYDMYLHIGELGGKITAVWVKNKDNTMFGTTESNALSIWYSVYENGAWSEPQCLRDGINTITDVTIGTDSVVYITDVNNNLTTVKSDPLTTPDGETEGTSDRLITVLKLDGEEIIETVTAEEAAYHDVSCVDGKIVYYVDNNLYEMDTEVALFKSAVADFPSEYKVLTDATGSAKAILFVKNVITDEETRANEDHIYGIFRDGDQWGAPICLTASVQGFGNGALVNDYDVIDRGTEMLLSVLLHTSVYNPESDDEYNQYVMEYQYETVFVAYPTNYEMGDVTFDYEAIKPGNKVTLSVTVTNLGYQTLTKVPVAITWENREFTDEIKTVILPGETEIVEVEFDPGDITEEEYTVRIQDDECSVTLWYSDVAVYGKQVIIGGTYYVVAYVVNNGNLPATYTMTVVVGDTELDPIKIENLLPSNKTHYTIPLPVTQNGSELVTLSIEADQEYITNNNITLINITTEAEQLVKIDFPKVWASVSEVVINRSNPVDQTIEFNGCYELVSILMDETELDEDCYDYDLNSVTIYSQKIADRFENGSYTVKLRVTDGSLNEEGDIVYKYAEITAIVTQAVKVTWVENESTSTTNDYLLGDIPTREAPVKESDELYHYVFVGWDCNDDGVADSPSPIMSDTVFVAIYDQVQREYTVTWIIDEDQSVQESYRYGEMPVFPGTPTKPSTDEYDYLFIEWDREITEITSDAIYTAVFEQSLRKYTITVCVDQSVYTMQVEYGTRPILMDPVKESTEQYDFAFGGWSPEISEVYGDQTYVATFTGSLREYTVTWIVDGVETSEQYRYGTTPDYGSIPFKQGNKQYTYDFVGWNHEITSVIGDVTYEAQFIARLNYYTVSFVVNETTYKTSYAFGEIPSFEGAVSKPTDETYRYTFVGWDRDFVEVTEDTVYIALFEKTLLGSATVTNTSFVTAWDCSFTTTVSLENVSNMTKSTLTVNYNPLLASLQTYDCHDNVQVLESGTGYITLLVTELKENEANNLIDLCFVTSIYAPVGESEFLHVYGEDLFESELEAMTIYQMGDVNMDGRINTVDAAMIQRYAVKKLDLNEVQKVYGNVNGDSNQDGTFKLNTVDAAMIQRFAVKKIDTLGNRITVTFVNGEEEVCISLTIGSTLSDLFAPGDGYAWSLEKEMLEPVDFSTLTEDTIVFMVPTENT